LDPARALRQTLLVGEAGQRAIEAARASCGGASAAHGVAALYAWRAGFAAVEPGDVGAVDDAVRLDAASCRDVLDGSRAAMRAILRALRSR
jgi:hypothetical protein